jgi:AhpD family alkylhydroperoxidase
MNERGFGRIVNIGSINGQAGQYGQVNYAAAKSGIHGFTKALAQEGASKGITVNAIAPGYIDTDMVRAVPAHVLEKIVAKIPVGRLGQAEEIARGVMFLIARRCRLHHRLDPVDQRRPAYVLTDRPEVAKMGPAHRRPFSFLEQSRMAKLTEYEDMNPRAKAVVDGIAKARGIDPAGINNVWKALARHPDTMERFAAEMKAVMAPGALDGLTKELIYLAVSVANQCDYCINSHGYMARQKGMTEEMFDEFMAVVLAAQKGNKIATGYRVPIDEAFEEK